MPGTILLILFVSPGRFIGVVGSIIERFAGYSIAANTSSSGTVANVVAESDMA